ncbi:hypothetical protein EKO27_g3860 [Xylaria grammica]|uniref:Tyrosine specific protein phosphatases domain-containing protein n=1 Tax=Xylaria grammica TaxID=363999 RepID=A0A439DA03_9PEZI|nr:hypothetical protein EKO27_g3860 [Xylaria grammica]
MSIEFEKILNFRDVGKTVNDYLGRKQGHAGGRAVSLGTTRTEHLTQAQKREADLKAPALLQSNAALAEPMQIPGPLYRHVRVAGRRLERALVRQLSWWNFMCVLLTLPTFFLRWVGFASHLDLPNSPAVHKLIFLFIFGFRVQAIRIMGQEVMQPLGLVGLSLLTLDESGSEIVEALQILTSSQTPNPSLVHCTQGKDRTGMIIALALLTLHVPTDAISHDYFLSQSGLEPERDERVAEMMQIGLPPAWGDCPPNFVQRVRGHLDERYGGVEGYLDTIGFGPEDRARLVDVFGA